MDIEDKFRNMKKMDLILLIIGIFIAAFIITMIVLFCVYQAVPDTLIQYVLGAGGLEALLLAIIKITKVKQGKEENDDEQFG